MRVLELDPGGIAGFGVLEAAIEGAQVVAAEVVGLVVEVQADSGAFAGDLVIALLELLQPGAVLKIPVAAGFDVVGAEVTLLPAQGGGDTEVVHAITEAEAVAERTGELGAGLADVLVVAAFGAEAVEQTVMIKRRQAFYLDGAAEGVGVHVRGQRLDHRERLHQFGGQHVQRHGATAAFRRGHQGAVDGDAVQIRRDAAHADEAAFTLIALDRKSGDALQGFGGVVVRQLADAVGVDHALHAVGVALFLQCFVEADGLADHFDVFHDKRLLGPGRTGADGQGQQADAEPCMADAAAVCAHEQIPRTLITGSIPELQRTVGSGYGGSVTGGGAGAPAGAY